MSASMRGSKLCVNVDFLMLEREMGLQGKHATLGHKEVLITKNFELFRLAIFISNHRIHRKADMNNNFT